MDDKKDNGVVMLEQTMTRDEEMLKSTPIVGKVDYSGAYEVCDHVNSLTHTTISQPHRKPIPAKSRSSRSWTDTSCPCCGPCTGSTTSIAMPSPWLVSTI
jgi:hypothetical protein